MVSNSSVNESTKQFQQLAVNNEANFIDITSDDDEIVYLETKRRKSSSVIAFSTEQEESTFDSGILMDVDDESDIMIIAASSDATEVVNMNIDEDDIEVVYCTEPQPSSVTSNEITIQQTAEKDAVLNTYEEDNEIQVLFCTEPITSVPETSNCFDIVMEENTEPNYVDFVVLVNQTNVVNNESRNRSSSVDIVYSKLDNRSCHLEPIENKPNPINNTPCYQIDPSLVEFAQEVCRESILARSSSKPIENYEVRPFQLLHNIHSRQSDNPLQTEVQATSDQNYFAQLQDASGDSGVYSEYPGPLPPPPPPPRLSSVKEPENIKLDMPDFSVLPPPPVAPVLYPIVPFESDVINRIVTVKRAVVPQQVSQKDMSQTTRKIFPNKPNEGPKKDQLDTIRHPIVSQSPFAYCNYQQKEADGAIRTKRKELQRPAESYNFDKITSSSSQNRNALLEIRKKIEKTVFTTSQLITLCLLNAPSGKASVGEMYPFILKHFSRFDRSPTAPWRATLLDILKDRTDYFVKVKSYGSSKKTVYELAEGHKIELVNDLSKTVMMNELSAFGLTKPEDLTNLLDGTIARTIRKSSFHQNTKPTGSQIPTEACHLVNPALYEQMMPNLRITRSTQKCKPLNMTDLIINRHVEELFDISCIPEKYEAFRKIPSKYRQLVSDMYFNKHGFRLNNNTYF